MLAPKGNMCVSLTLQLLTGETILFLSAGCPLLTFHIYYRPLLEEKGVIQRRLLTTKGEEKTHHFQPLEGWWTVAEVGGTDTGEGISLPLPHRLWLRLKFCMVCVD